MGLFKPIWMKDKNEQAALSSIKYVKEEEKLEQAALGAPFLSVRTEAVRKVTDQKFLFNYLSALAADRSLSLRAGFPELAKAAIISLTDPALKKQLALADPWFGGELVRFIHSQDDLHEIALKHGIYTGTDAIGRLLDPEALLLFMEAGPDYIRETAQSRLNECLKDYRDRPEMTAEQNKRYHAVLLSWPENCNIGSELSLPYMQAKDLWILFRQALHMNVRIGAAQSLIYKAGPDDLRILDSEIDGLIRELKTKGSTASSWESVRSRIGERIARLAEKDPVQLLDYIREAGLDFEAGVSCLRQLFDPKLDGTEDICALREKAVTAALERVPAWAGNKSHDPYLYRIARALPLDKAAEFGFTVTQHEVPGEDEFGRYTNTETCVSYQGRMLSAT